VILAWYPTNHFPPLFFKNCVCPFFFLCVCIFVCMFARILFVCLRVFSSHDPRTLHHDVFESHCKRHAFCYHSTLALHVNLAACNPSSRCRFWVLNAQLVSTTCHSNSILLLLNHHGNPIFVPIYLFSFSCSALVAKVFLIRMDLSFEFLFEIQLSSPQWFHYYFYLSMVSWQYHQRYCTILIFCLRLLCIKLLVCSTYSRFAPPSHSFSSSWQRNWDVFTYTLVL